MQSYLLSDLIARSVPFRTLNTGWLAGRCALCSDYKERAGFKFENGSVIYNCFNCGATAVFQEGSGKMNDRFKKVCAAFGIDRDEIAKVLGSALFQRESAKDATISMNSLIKKSVVAPPIPQPPDWLELGAVATHQEQQIELLRYLEKRCVDVTRYKFFFSPQEKFKNRVIIPFYRNGRLVFWQARSILDTEKKRYENAPVPREGVVFNGDALTKHTKLPLFICEGVFDAMMYDGVALLGSRITSKLELLQNSTRRCIFVIDKDANGRHLAEEALKYGWEITFTPPGTSDVNNSVTRFGRSWTASQLMSAIPRDADEAAVKLRLLCN